MVLAIQILVFSIVVLVTLAIAREVERVLAQRRRLGQQAFVGRQAASNLVQSQDVQNRFFRWVQSSTSISDRTERAKLRRELALAGFDFPAAPIWHKVAGFGLAIGLPFVYLLFNSLLAAPASGMSLIFAALVLCGLGLVLPNLVVGKLASWRRDQIEREFPDSLDLMVVCIEAGLSLDASFIRVGQEIRESHPRMAKEIGRVSEELRAGRTRSDTLRDMADRTDVVGIRSFVALVIQTEALGASITQALRTYSAEMRETRYLKAEERAMRIPVLMSVPVVTCMLPVIVGSLMLPAIIDVVRVVMPALAGHAGGG
jgi:tight adherence protein C